MLQKSYSYFVRGMADGVETRDSIGQHELPLMVSTQNEDFEACNTYCVGEYSYTATDQIMKIYRHFFVFQCPSDFLLEISSKYIK